MKVPVWRFYERMETVEQWFECKWLRVIVEITISDLVTCEASF